MPKKMSKNEKNSNRRADRRADYVKWRCTEIAEVWGGSKTAFEGDSGNCGKCANGEKWGVETKYKYNRNGSFFFVKF